MYKILYLPLGEEVLISSYEMRSFIPTGLRPADNEYGLKSPKAPNNNRFKIALFETENVAKTWLYELVTRPANAEHKLIYQHFQIMKV